MTAPSPEQVASAIAGFAITVDGAALDSSIQVVSIEVWQGVNRVPRARVVVSDGSPATEDFPISSGTALVPGVKIVIELGYASSNSTVFSGVIVRHGLEISRNGPSRLVIEASDPALVMTLARSNAVFQNMTDSAICEKLIGDAGLTAKVTSTSTSHESLVQYYASAWDLLVMRAEANGMVVMVDAGTVTVAPPDTSSDPVLTLGYGEAILDLRLEVDAASQFAPSAVQSFAWDPATQALAESSGASASVSTPGNLSSAKLADVFSVSPLLQQTGGAMLATELTDWSSAELARSQLAKVRGQVRFQGSALAKLGTCVALAGVGDRFNGNGWISGIQHRLAEGLWTTTADIGLAPGWFAEHAANIVAPGASGQLPAMNNVQTGLVKQIDQDPDGEFRVLVTLPLLQVDDGVWARLGCFYASSGFGANFFPEIGDEVVLGFLNADPRYPVILGSLYSKGRAPPYPPQSGGEGAPNNTKSIMSKSKLHIDFVESDPQLLIATPAGQSLCLNDKAGSVTIKDSNGNSITLDSSGITIKSASDIKLTATGSISLSADANVTINASASLTANASASAKFSADGPVTVKGAMVSLNP